jgi:hypothetical protein
MTDTPITITWAGCVPLLLAGLETGNPTARAELVRMAELADRITAIRAFAVAYNETLADEGIAPNGDDYNDVLDGIHCCLDGIVPPTVNVTAKER